METNNLKIKFNLLNILLIITILFSTTGLILAKAEKTALNKIIQGKEKIAIELLLPDVHSDEKEIFKVGKKASITIRNRPYTKLAIIKTESKPKFITISDIRGSYKIIEDPTKINVRDYIVTLADTALKTDDGYIIGGNKIKIGNQIELEGFNYRINGKVINVYPLSNKINE